MATTPTASPHFLADLNAIAWFIAPLVIVEAIQTRTDFLDGRLRIPLPARACLYSVLAAFLVLGASTYDYEFYYFRF
jgi:hypothetical protein